MANRAIRTTLPDGRTALNNIIDKFTGESIQLVKIPSLPAGVTADGIIYFQTNDATWGVEYWKRSFTGGMNLEWFGAKGDGVTDDTNAVQKAFNIGGKIDLLNKTFVVGSLSIDKSINILNGKLLLKHLNRITVTSTGKLIAENISFDNNNTTASVATIVGVSGCSLYFRNCIFENIRTIDPSIITNYGHGTATPVAANQYGILFPMDSSSLEIDSCVFRNISAMGDADGAETNNGFCGGVFLQGGKSISYVPSDSNYYRTIYSSPSKVTITNSEFNNIYTLKNPNNPGALDSDADAIRTSITGFNKEQFDINFNINISNIKFIDIQKSCFKLAAIRGIIISGISVTTETMTDIPMIGTIRTQEAADIQARDITYTGECSYILAFRGTSNVSISNLVVNTPVTGNSSLILFQAGNSNLTINDVRGTVPVLLRHDGINDNLTQSVTNLTLSNLNIFSEGSPHSAYALLKNAPNFSLLDSTINCGTSTSEFIRFEGSPNPKINNTTITAGGTIISTIYDPLVFGPFNITISNSEFYRTLANRNIPIIRLGGGGGGTVNGVNISSVIIETFSQASYTNDNLIQCVGEDVTLNNITLRIKQDGSNSSNPSYGLISFSGANEIKLLGLKVLHDFNPSGGAYSIVVNNCNKLILENIMVRRGGGIVFETNASSDIVINGIYVNSGKTAVLQSTPASNITIINDEQVL